MNTYWGLRDYQTEPLVWGGDANHAHEWGSLLAPVGNVLRNGQGASRLEDHGDDGRSPYLDALHESKPRSSGTFCPCGSWLGSLGLEPTPELFIAHLVEVFREVRRVLHPSGTVWLNLGDSYAGSGNGAHDYRERSTSTSLSLNAEKYQGQSPGALQRVGPQEHTEGAGRVHGYKAKDLMMLPSRVAIALQADGWWLRSMIPWVKGSAMPESVSDRPSSSVEYVFLLTKARTYFYDADAVRVPSTSDHRSGNGYARPEQLSRGGRGQSAPWEVQSHRNRRNGDWLMESLTGLLHDEAGVPKVLLVNPTGYAGAHFATFPPRLVEPMVKASTSEKGQCPGCRAPWVRVTASTPAYRERLAHANDRGDWYDRVDTTAKRKDGTKQSKQERGVTAEYTTTGWRATCAHTDAVPIPQTILDPFSGAGTALLVADRLGRNAIGIDLKVEYADMARERVTAEAPMFTEYVS